MEKILKRNTLRGNDIGFIQYTTKMVISIAVALFLCFVFSTRRSVTESYLMCTLTFAFATWFMSVLFFKDTWITKVVITSYFVKVIVGLVHYLIFFDSEYFSSSGVYLNYSNEEYSGVYNSICTIVDDKLTYGLWFMEDEMLFVNHPEITNIISLPFLFFGKYILSISPFNSWCSSIVCISFVCLGQGYLKLSGVKLRALVYLTAYFPFFIFSDYFARDIAGMTVMSIGATIFFLSDRLLLKIISMLCAMYLFYIHRTIYPILLLLTVLFGPVLSSSRRAFFINGLFAIILAISFNYLGETLLPLFFTDVSADMYESTMNMEANNIIAKISGFTIGPLWRRIYTAPEYSFVFEESFVIFLLDASLVAIYKCRKSLSISNVNSLMVLGALLLIVGAFNASAHVPYIAVGVLFLLPFIVDVTVPKVLLRSFIKISIMLVTLNLLSLFVSFGILG